MKERKVFRMTNIKLLVVEDESIVAMDIKMRLQNLGYTVPAIAYSGEDAIRMAAETRPDIVLMDIMLGEGMDGVEAAEHIRQNFDIPVIYLTAYADEKTLSRAKITKPYGYILKPFEERELYSNVEIAIYNHKMEKELRDSRQWLHATIKSIGDAVIATDKDGIIKECNIITPTVQNLNMMEQDIITIVNTALEKKKSKDYS